MAEQSREDPNLVRPDPLHSFVSRFSLFVAVLVLWVTAAVLVLDLRRDSFDLGRGLLLCGIAALGAGAMWLFMLRLVARPLAKLQAAIAAARKGGMETVPVSKTGDEIELLTASYNALIEALAASQKANQDERASLQKKVAELNSALQESARREHAASQAKGEVLANLARLLKPSIDDAVSVLGPAIGSPGGAELQSARNRASASLSLLNNLVDLSKLEAGQLVLEKSPFDFRLLLSECVQVCRPEAAENSVGVRCEVAQDVPRMIVGDALRLRQIASNLLATVIKFSDHGAVEVMAGGKRIGPGQFRLEITVRTSGNGIPADKLLHVLDHAAEDETDLRLAVARSLAELHGGQIEVHGEQGRGSAFTVTLACEADDSASEMETTKSDAPAVRVDGSPHAARILVVEDNHVNQKVVTAVLRKRGFSIELANDGREALNKLANGGFDLVLMDVQMPVLDGLEATRLIRKDARWNRLPIVAMTAHAMTGDKERCLEAGMNGYISKPVHPSLLLSTVDEFLLQKAG